MVTRRDSHTRTINTQLLTLTSEEGERPAPLHIRSPPPSPVPQRQHIESSVLSFSSLKQLFGRENKTYRPIHSSVLEVGFSFPTRSSSFFLIHLQMGENWLDFLRTIAGYLADKEE